MSAFDEHGAQGLVSHARTGGPALAGALAVAGTQACPCGETVDAAEGVEVGSDLGEDCTGRGAVDPGDGHEEEDAILPGHRCVVDVAVERLDALFQGVMIAQQVTQDQTVGRAEGEAESIAEALDLVHHNDG